MKKTITLTLITLLAGAVSGYSQGNIQFNADLSTFRQAVFNTQASDLTYGTYVTYGNYIVYETIGSSTYQRESPTGSTVYIGAPLSGTGYDAELLIGPAGIYTPDGTVMVNGDPVGLLPFGGPGNNGIIAHFNTGAANVGFINSTNAIELPAESYYAVGDSVSVAIAAWDNQDGTVNSLAAAQQAGVPWGISNVEQSGALTALPDNPVALPTTIESFSLGEPVPTNIIVSTPTTYYYTGPLLGCYTSVNLAPSGDTGGFNAIFGTLSETVVFDPVGETIEESGTVTASPSSGSFNIVSYNTLGGDATIVGSATLTVGNNGTFSFDRTFPASYWAPGAGSTLLVPVSGFGTYEGQAFAGSWNIELPLVTQILAASPTSLTFTESNALQEPPAGFNPVAPYGQQVLGGFSDGTDEFLQQGYDADCLIYNWNLGTVVVTVTNAAASITGQPQSVVVDAFGTVSFAVTASGTAPLSYQWSFNGTNIPGETFSTLIVSNITQTNLGTYTVIVANNLATNTSSNAVLSMYPFLVHPFIGLDTYWGQTNTLSVGAWGTGPLNYQWFDDGVAVDGATNSNLTLTSIQLTNAGLYSVVVSSALSSVTNSPAQVVVNPANVSLQLCPNLMIQGTVGYNYIIQSTTNLADTNSWATQTNLTLTQPVQYWDDTNTDVNQPSNPRTFYRVLPGQEP